MLFLITNPLSSVYLLQIQSLSPFKKRGWGFFCFRDLLKSSFKQCFPNWQALHSGWLSFPFFKPLCTSLRSPGLEETQAFLLIFHSSRILHSPPPCLTLPVTAQAGLELLISEHVSRAQVIPYVNLKYRTFQPLSCGLDLIPLLYRTRVPLLPSDSPSSLKGRLFPEPDISSSLSSLSPAQQGTQSLTHSAWQLFCKHVPVFKCPAASQNALNSSWFRMGGITAV